jgi:exodeoxyribonuclease VII large subunit
MRDVSRGLPRPEALLAERVQRLDGLGMRLPRALTALAREKRLRLGQGRAGRFGPGLLVALIARRRQGLLEAAAGLRADAMRGRLARRADRLEARGERLDRSGATLMAPRRAALEGLARTLASLGPQSVLTRGYAIVRDGSGVVVTQSAVAAKAAMLELEFGDGRVGARPEVPRPMVRGKAPPVGQGSLF